MNAERRTLLHIAGGPDRDRSLAAALQQGAATLVAWISTTGTRGAGLAVVKTRGVNAGSKLTFQTDHSLGAGQCAHSLICRNLEQTAIRSLSDDALCK
jgi:hypothetical protein